MQTITSTVKGVVNCNNTHVVYRLECARGCYYIGQTKRRLRDRGAEHRYASHNGSPAYPMARHYLAAAHGCESVLRVTSTGLCEITTYWVQPTVRQDSPRKASVPPSFFSRVSPC